MGTVYNRESVQDIWNDMLPMISNQMSEVDSSSCIPNPDIDMYLELEQEDSVLFISARDTSTNKLLGYTCTLLMTNHHTQEKVAKIDAIYVQPAYRARGVGVRILLATEKYIASNYTVTALYCAAPIQNYKLLGVLNKLGYVDKEITLRKEI